MEMSPHQVRHASFKSAKRGFDPEEVQAFLRDVAESLEAAQNQSTAMEARARAAVARLQEVTTAREAAPEPVSTGDAETISRTLLLAQRTADTTVSEAKTEADRIVAAAHEEAASTIDSTREMSSRLLDEARSEARQVSEVELKTARSEVEALVARRDFLESDVDQLEHFLVDQRDRLRQAASALLDVSERVPGGLGGVRRPLLSASDDSAPPLESRTPGHAASETPSDTPPATEPGSSSGAPSDDPYAGGAYADSETAVDTPGEDDAGSADDPTMQIDAPPTDDDEWRRESSAGPPGDDAAGDDAAGDDPSGDDPAVDGPVVTTPWASEREGEPQFRFGVSETRPLD